MAFPPRPRVGPTLPGERFLEIDVLRGFALLGILVVNMDSFAWPLTDSRLTWTDTGGIADRVAGALIRFLAEGKFYTLFSLLFGFGLAMQMKRAEARTAPFVSVFLRRLAVLFGFGLLHGVLLWYGDILMTYAVLGVPLLLFRHRRPRALVVWSAVCLLLTLLFFTGVVGIAGLIGMPQSGQSSGQAADAEERQEIQQDIRVYSQGTFREIMAQRINDLVFISLLGIPTLPTVFAMFLLGLLAGRSGVIEDVPNHRSRLRRIAIWGLGIGIAGNAVYILAGPQDLPGPLLVSTIGQILGGPALMLFYACGIVLLLQREEWRRRLAVLAPAGRMPLTNYLLQSIVCTTIFYGYGLGLYGKVGLAAGLALAACIFIVQIWLSAWWFRKFSFGALEWVWRTLTYGGLPAPHG